MARPGLEPGTPRFSVVRVSLSNRTKSPAFKCHRTTFLSARNGRKSHAFPGDSGDGRPRRPNVRECYLRNPDPALDCACGGEAQWARTVSWAVPWAGVHEGVVEESESSSERPTPVPGAHEELHGPNSCDRSVECGPGAVAVVSMRPNLPWAGNRRSLGAIQAAWRPNLACFQDFVAPEPHQPSQEPCAFCDIPREFWHVAPRRVAKTWKAGRGEFVRATVVATDPDRGDGCYGRIALVLNPRTSPLHPASALGRVLRDRHGHRIAHASQEPSPASRHHRSIVSLIEEPSWLRAPDAARRPRGRKRCDGHDEVTSEPTGSPAPGIIPDPELSAAE